jgi:hypothetical protein
LANQQNSMKRKRLEPVKPAPKHISRLPSIEEHLINQLLFSYSLTQVPNKIVSHLLKNILVLKAIAEDSNTHQLVWDPGGKLPKSQPTLNRNQMEWTINGIRSQLTEQLLLIQAIHLQPHF